MFRKPHYHYIELKFPNFVNILKTNTVLSNSKRYITSSFTSLLSSSIESAKTLLNIISSSSHENSEVQVLLTPKPMNLSSFLLSENFLLFQSFISSSPACLIPVLNFLFQKNFSLTDEIHKFGINCRQLGRIRSRILLTDDKAQFKPAFILVEIIARTCKNHLQEQWRLSMEEKRVASSEPYLNVAVDYLNVLLRDEVSFLDPTPPPLTCPPVASMLLRVEPASLPDNFHLPGSDSLSSPLPSSRVLIFLRADAT